ncbi:hypothetical protein BSLG_005100 [Batrachochytrium salamandrivorans]|nr:hypothetical protein BSLG_005100 [Batrachochytrium salamandrivorans]
MLFTTVIISTLALVASTSAFTVDRPGHSAHTGPQGNNDGHLGKRQFGMGGFPRPTTGWWLVMAAMVALMAAMVALAAMVACDGNLQRRAFLKLVPLAQDKDKDRASVVPLAQGEDRAAEEVAARVPQTLKSIIAMIIGIRSQGPFEGSSLALFFLIYTLPIIAHFQSKYAMHVCTVI